MVDLVLKIIYHDKKIILQSNIEVYIIRILGKIRSFPVKNTSRKLPLTFQGYNFKRCYNILGTPIRDIFIL